MVRKYEELPAEQLRRVCDPNTFQFKSTAELPPLQGYPTLALVAI